jgi:hypothetical protein
MELVNIEYSGRGNDLGQLSSQDRSLVTTNFINTSFGNPSDYLELFIYDENNLLLFSDYNAFDYYPYLLNNPQNNTYSALSLDPEKDLKNRGFFRGDLNIKYNFYTKLFNSSFGTYYWIKEISPSRKEIKLASQTLSNDIIRGGFLSYQSYIATKNYYPVFYLNFGENQIVAANNVAYTEDDDGSYLIIKLYEPLPIEFGLKSQLWIIDKVAESVSFNVSITVEAENIQELNRLRGPNFNVQINDKNGQTTPYYNYNNLLASPVSSSYQKLLSYYQDRSVAINVDYTNFSNFIHFSSAVERVNNFVYKVGLIEQYKNQQYSQSLVAGGSGNVTYAVNSIDVSQQAIDNIIEKFDTYEYFLYFNSSSWAWPKSNSTQPYQLYSVTSSQVSNFLGSENAVPTATTQSLLFSASYYDSTNKDLLHNSIPQYLLDDPNNQSFITFMDMIGQHFDNIWIYYKDVSNRYNATNNPDTGISLDVVGDALRGFGIQLYTNSNISDNLYYTLFGLNTDGSLLPPTGSEKITAIGGNYVTSSLETLSAKEIQQELYKRLYHNLPYLLKSKGTERGVKALISTFGIPDNILTVREFGGTPIDSVDGIFDLDSSAYKVTIVTGSSGNVTGSLTLSSSLLHPEASLQYYQNINRINTTNIEVGFSPADTINDNIVSSEGYFDINQLISSPGYQYSSSYLPLDDFKNTYFSNYTEPNSIWEYIRLIKFYNNSLFKMIKDYVPARSNLSTGIIVKSHMLERNKYARHEPSSSFNDNYSQSIDTAFISGSSAGSVIGSTAFTGSIITPSGSIQFISSDGIEKYNGEFSGSTIIVTDGQALPQFEISQLPSSSLYVTYSLGALYQNVTQSVRSQILFDLDYNSDQIKAVNYGIVTKSMNDAQIDNYTTYTNPNNPYAYVQDYNYNLKRSVIPRYSGSYIQSALYNVYTAGDISYGKTATIDKIKYQYAYLVDIYSASFQLPQRANAQIKYFIDNNENVLDLTKLNTNIFTTQNVFKSGETLDVSLFDYDNTNPYIQKLTNNNTFTIYEGGYRYSPTLFNVGGSGSMNYVLDEPLQVVSSVTVPSTTPLNPGDTNYWTINNSDLDLYKPNPFAPLILSVTASSVVGGTSTAAVNVSLQIRNTSARNTIYYSVPEFQIPSGLSVYQFSINLPSGVYSDWVDADIVVVNNLSEAQFNPNGGGTVDSVEFITSVTDQDTCWIAIDPRNIKMSLTQSAYYDAGFLFSGSYPGIDTPVFDFTLNQMDLLRFYNTGSGWSINSEYRVLSVQPYIDSTGSYYSITIDRDLNLSDTSGSSYPAKICKYIILKRLPDETNVILNYNLGTPITQDGVLFPQYIDPVVRDNSGNVIKSLRQQNLLDPNTNTLIFQ